jgi:hypothetical protein
MSLAEGTSIGSIAGRLAADFAAGSKDTEIMALAARHEGFGPTAAEMSMGETPPVDRRARLVGAD